MPRTAKTVKPKPPTIFGIAFRLKSEAAAQKYAAQYSVSVAEASAVLKREAASLERLAQSAHEAGDRARDHRAAGLPTSANHLREQEGYAKQAEDHLRQLRSWGLVD